MGMLLHRRLADKKPEPVDKKPVQEVKAEPAKKPGRPKKTQ